jgi:prephenate dehydrogenase
MRPDSLLVVGLGPVGGSLAWAAVRAGIPRVVGYSGERRDAVQALSAGAVHEIADRVERAVSAADLMIVTLPGSGAELLTRSAPHLRPSAFLSSVVDLARPAAAAVVSAGLETRWAASHPLRATTGDGFAAARPELFRGAVVYVAPAAETEGDGAAREVMHFWEEVIGASPVRIAPGTHDDTLGWMEQLPRLLAASVATAYGARGLGAQSWGSDARAMTALADHDPAQLAEALVANRDAAEAALAATTGALRSLAVAIAAGDTPRVVTLLEEARRIRRGSDR